LRGSVWTHARRGQLRLTVTSVTCPPLEIHREEACTDEPLRAAIGENRKMPPVGPEPAPETRIAPTPGPGDFYYDGPYVVFTEKYHLRRGWCCQSGCRHCPYGFVKPGPEPSPEPGKEP